MKLESTLPERPGLLHAVPVLDLFALLWLMVLLAPSLLQQSGVSVELPPSRFKLDRFPDALVVTLGPGEAEPRIHFGRDLVTLAGLSLRLGPIALRRRPDEGDRAAPDGCGHSCGHRARGRRACARQRIPAGIGRGEHSRRRAGRRANGSGMMAKRLSRKDLRMDDSEWLFQWRRTKEASYHKWIAIALVSGFFALLLTSVRIRVAVPTPWATSTASLIQVGDDPDSQALKLRAQEGGPFLSRLDPAEWAGLAALETEAIDAAFAVRTQYVPSLRELPDDDVVTPPRLASKGEPVFPERPWSPRTIPAGTLKPAPTLHPLSGLKFDDLPRELPPFDAAVDSAMIAEPWRFLVSLGPSGTVRDCISIAGGDEAGAGSAALIEDWLRGVKFKLEPESPARWIAVGVRFVNQPADGSEPR